MGILYYYVKYYRGYGNLKMYIFVKLFLRTIIILNIYNKITEKTLI